MPFIEWNDTFSVSVDEIDNQHKKLFGIINELHDSVVERNSKRVIGGLLKELLDYTDYHFKSEEKLYELFNFSYKFHKKIHEDFISYIYHICNLIKKDNIKFELDIDKKTFIQGYPNELGQGLLNIVNNAKDALVENDSISEKIIKIYTYTDEDKVYIIIEDNAGGIQ